MVRAKPPPIAPGPSNSLNHGRKGRIAPWADIDQRVPILVEHGPESKQAWMSPQRDSQALLVLKLDFAVASDPCMREAGKPVLFASHRFGLINDFAALNYQGLDKLAGMPKRSTSSTRSNSTLFELPPSVQRAGAGATSMRRCSLQVALC